jgi:tetratricopeptide (TPR) repeat protein
MRVVQLANLVEPEWLSAVAPVLPALAEHLPDLPALAPLDHREEQRRLLDGLVHCLTGLASVAPLLLVLEDVHWADEATLTALEHVIPALPASRVFIILTGRTAEARERNVVWETLDTLDRTLPMLRLYLQPLALAETKELLERALGVSEDKAQAAVLAERLQDETGGNALFLVESLRTLLEQQVLVCSPDGRWVLSPEQLASSVAVSIQDIVADRLLRLEPVLREVLELIAVLGDDADFPVLVRVGDGSPTALLSALAKLKHYGFLIETEARYQFEHERVREIVSQAIERERGLELRRRVGTVLEELEPDKVEVLAHHFDLGEVWDKALAYTVQAAERAGAVHAHPAALDHYQRAATLVSLAGADDAQRFDLLAARESILDVLARRQDQADVLETMEGLAQDDVHRLVEVLRRRIWLLMHTGRYKEAGETAHQALRLAEGEGGAAAKAAILSALGSLVNWSGKPAEAVPHLEQAILLFEQQEDTEGEARARVGLAGALLGIKAYDKAASELEQALSLYASLEDRLQIVEASNLLGILHMERGDITSAIASYERALGIAREIGYRYGEVRNLINLGNLFYVQGQIGRALAIYDEGIPLFETLGERRGEAQARINRASVRCSFLGGDDMALADAEAALSLYREMGEAIGQGQSLAVLGQIALGRGQLEEARAYLEEGLGLLLESGERWIGVQVYCILIDLALKEGCPDTALRHVEEAEAICRDLGMEALAVSVSSLRGLALLALDQPDAALAATTEALEQLGPGVEQAFMVAFRHYQVLHAMGRTEQAHAAVKQAHDLLSDAIGGLSPEQQEISLEHVPEHRAIASAWESSRPRCVTIFLPHADAPTGRPLRDDEWVEVTWTVAAPEDDEIVGKAPRRRHRVLRLLRQAKARSAAPKVEHLADALDVNERTIRRDLAALRDAGHDVLTRGSRTGDK